MKNHASPTSRSLGLVLFVVTSLGRLSMGGEPATAQHLAFFETDIRPILAEHCYSCHSVNATKLQAGLKVDSRAALIQGGDSGTSLVPGDVDESLLVEAVRYESYEMPPAGKLSDAQIQAIEKWVSIGAPWPDEPPPQSDQQRETFDLQRRAAEHWVWQPIADPPLPAVDSASWPQADLDRYILNRLEQAQLAPAADTDRTALARRLYFDLTGLPPTTQQLQTYLDDSSEQATSRLVDQLLESPRFGERWGRHWLDLVRYAESRGHEFDNDAENAYQYRDYVIRGLNADVPYDQWVREHIAGDLLESPRLHPEQGFNESILGTGFWFLGEWVHSPVDIRKDEADRFDNMIDVMSKTFLGVTVACARCHDHKFDAISTADYYALTGFLQGCDYRQVRFESLSHNQNISAKLADLDATFQRQIDDLLKEQASPTTKTEKASVESIAVQLGETCAVDYTTLGGSPWLQDGFIFGRRSQVAGEVKVAVDEKGQPQLRVVQRSAATSDSFWDGLKTIDEKGIHHRSALMKLPRPGRTLRTPTFELQHGEVVCRVHGSGHVVACVDSHRLIAGPLHGGTIKRIKPKDNWVRLNLGRYLGHRIHLEFTPDEDQALEVALVLQNPTASQIEQVEAWERTEIEAALARQQEIDHMLAQDDPRSQTLTKRTQQWAAARQSLEQQVQRKSQAAMAMLDGTGEDDHILIRGNSSKPGKREPRHFLTAISGDKPLAAGPGSGRMELAEIINSPNNPLTARVLVNRVWHHLMGRGIVPTTDDFGVLGQRPTHPELLDHLATRFLADSRSLKRLIRYIVLSRTYQMSSHADPAAVASDPKNLLWHHRWPKRLEGETIRDAMLALSGQLDDTMFGEPVPIHLTAFMDGRGRPGVNGPLDGNGRRSIYISVRRNFLSPFMLTFDTPVPFSTMGRRNVSNVPAQALILMNDPLVVQQAHRWAERTIKLFPIDQDKNTSQIRIDWMYQSAFARQPTVRESELALQFLGTADVSTTHDDVAKWADLAHALINTKEFIFLR